MRVTNQHLQPLERFSDAEFSRRHAAARQVLVDHDLGALVLYANAAMPANLRYLTGFAPYGNGAAYLIFPAAAEPLLLVSIFSHVASAQQLAAVPAAWAGPDPAATIASKLDELGLASSRIGLVELDSARNRGLPSSLLDGLHARLPNAELAIVTAELERLRRIKSPEEVAALEASARLTEQALEAMVAAARPGASERDLLAAFASSAIRSGGTVEVALLGSTSMARPSMATPRIQPTGRVLQPGDCILSELGVGFLGYSTQLLRPIAVGPPNALYQDLFDLAAQVYRSVQQALKPGATEKDIQAAAAALQRPDIATEAPIVHGWSQWSEFGYHIAMPGQESHWHGRPVRFEAGMSVTIEPNPCTPDFRAGVFLGDLHIVEPDGARSLHQWPLEFIVV